MLAILSIALADACYAYQPIEGAPAPGTGDESPAGSAAAATPIVAGDELRITLTPDGARELTRVLGPGVRMAEGSVAGVDSTGAITLAVEFVQLNNGLRMPWTGEGVVTFPSAFREVVSRHAFQKRQTIVASIALTAALIATAVLALRQGGAGGDGTAAPPPPPP